MEVFSQSLMQREFEQTCVVQEIQNFELVDKILGFKDNFGQRVEPILKDVSVAATLLNA